MSTHTVNTDEAEDHLAELIKLVRKGKEVVIAQKNQSHHPLSWLPVDAKPRNEWLGYTKVRYI